LDFNEDAVYSVDASKYGNFSHFINHSCDPNLAVFNVWVDCLDPNLPKLAMFANRDIAKVSCKTPKLNFKQLNNKFIIFCRMRNSVSTTQTSFLTSLSIKMRRLALALQSNLLEMPRN
jgi:hypothetical protein